MQRNRTLILCRFVVLLFLLSGPGGPAAAQEPVLWDHWLAHDPDSSITVNQDAWARFLRRYVFETAEGGTAVDYTGVSDTDLELLLDHISELEEVVPSRLSRDEQQAYWINLYNATTVALVVESYPIGSTLEIDITPGLFARGPWGAKLLMIDDQTVSLNDILHRILRPIWQDSRTHYALNWGAIGSPDLRPKPWFAATLDTDLDAAARRFVNHPRSVFIDAEGRLSVSKFYEAMSEDFGSTAAGILEHVTRYAEPGLREALQGRSEIDRFPFDWGLNIYRSN